MYKGVEGTQSSMMDDRAIDQQVYEYPNRPLLILLARVMLIL